MSDQVRLVAQVVGVILALIGTMMLGVVIGKLKEARAEGDDAQPNAALAGAAASLCGSGAALIGLSSI